MKKSILQWGIVSGFVDLFKTTKPPVGKKAMRRLMNDTKKLYFTNFLEFINNG